MAEDNLPENTEHASRLPGNPDRRACLQVTPPPFITRNGKVEADRRSHIDRRAEWIRSFSFEPGDGQPG